MSQYRVTVNNNTITVDTSSVSYAVSQSRTGGQGTKGDSITNAAINNDGNLIVTITRADGTTYDVDAGNIESNIQLTDLDEITLTNTQDGDVLIWNAADGEFQNHQLTTSKLLDVDNTNRADGALLVYDSTAQKYQATTRIEKATTTVTGGNY